MLRLGLARGWEEIGQQLRWEGGHAVDSQTETIAGRVDGVVSQNAGASAFGKLAS